MNALHALIEAQAVEIAALRRRMAAERDGLDVDGVLAAAGLADVSGPLVRRLVAAVLVLSDAARDGVASDGATYRLTYEVPSTYVLGESERHQMVALRCRANELLARHGLVLRGRGARRHAIVARPEGVLTGPRPPHHEPCPGCGGRMLVNGTADRCSKCRDRGNGPARRGPCGHFVGAGEHACTISAPRPASSWRCVECRIPVSRGAARCRPHAVVQRYGLEWAS